MGMLRPARGFFRSISRFLFCFQSAGGIRGHSSGILVVYFGFQGLNHKGIFTNGKDPTNSCRESDGILTGMHTHKRVNNAFIVNFVMKQLHF